MTDTTKIIRPGGRRVAIHQLAQGGIGRTVLFVHPAPGSGSFDPDPEQTHGQGVTLLALDRPGYGDSDPVPAGEWASVATAADDAAAAVDELGTGPVAVAGWSAGGRVALALAARRPDLVDRVVVVGTPAPDEHVPWIPQPQRDGLEAMRGMPPEQVHAALSEQLAGLAPGGLDADEMLATLGVDRAVDASALAAPGARERLAEMLRAAHAQGVAGLAADIAGYCLQPWGFEPADVAATVLLLYGQSDPVAGHAHGEWWQRHLPDARLEMVPDIGHLVVIPTWKRALAHLMS